MKKYIYTPLTAPPFRSVWFKTLLFIIAISLSIWIIFSYAQPLYEYEEDAITEKKLFDILANSSKLSDQDITAIKRKIAMINNEARIYNNKKFGPIQNDSLVIVVQVHNRIAYLKYLISSLKMAKGISNAIVIFSHDFFNEEINSLIQSIDFCKVMQIFYPYSIQLYSKEFPGTDPRDCPQNTRKNDAIRRSCKNVMGYDKNGKYRVASAAQLKHHWWWKANQVFNLAVLQQYDGLFLFLEEDLFVTEDFIPALRVMQEAVKTQCIYCKILSLAENVKAIHFKATDFGESKLAVATTRFSNMGLSFNRSTWNEIADCRNQFCYFDDCNWDFSLQHVFTACMARSAAMTLSAPRVFHIGTCGAHFQSDNCDPHETVTKIHQMLTMVKHQLYPSNLSVWHNIVNDKFFEGYGGWGDSRDHALCLGMTIK